MGTGSCLAKIIKTIDTLNEWIGKGVSWVVILLVAVVFVDVVMRYAFNTSFVFTQELEWHLFGFIFLMGAGYTLLYDQHVRVDVVYQRLSEKAQAWVNVLGCIFFLFPGAVLIIYVSTVFTWESLKFMEGSPDPGGIPLRFILKGCIPLGFVFFFLQGISMFVRNLNIILGHRPNENQEMLN
ncbi:TRAP transporter small permease subunit [Desulfobacula sp.]|uniref:TRAP transporter small permease subunit n=1 Tax=Desulfobacula sp. TaxID=2593537 RepID=UPI0026362114|nr:TRAP transporter small permease subunit [Desulfobacula sp.]